MDVQVNDIWTWNKGEMRETFLIVKKNECGRLLDIYCLEKDILVANYRVATMEYQESHWKLVSRNDAWLTQNQ